MHASRNQCSQHSFCVQQIFQGLKFKLSEKISIHDPLQLPGKESRPTPHDLLMMKFNINGCSIIDFGVIIKNWIWFFHLVNLSNVVLSVIGIWELQCFGDYVQFLLLIRSVKRTMIKVSYLNQSTLLPCLGLSGSGIQSKGEFLFGSIEMLIKLVPGNSAGTVTAYYVSIVQPKRSQVEVILTNTIICIYCIFHNVSSIESGSSMAAEYQCQCIMCVGKPIHVGYGLTKT